MFYNSRTDGIFGVNFLQDFQRNGHKFTEELCLADSDRDGVPNGVELGLNTTRHNIQTLCQFVASYTFNAKLINFLERKSLLGRPIGHPGKKGVSSSISHTEIPCSVRNMYIMCQFMAFDLNSWIGRIIVQQLPLAIMRQSYINQHAF